ncbi:hypothetical protein [Rhodospirillum sp. A1_3_36]|uniref:hypothetical protein n=1 Tax=Rhodospirillum sp. A1_3_36 TaxID=3391666 RepID=UPI0039A6564B
MTGEFEDQWDLLRKAEDVDVAKARADAKQCLRIMTKAFRDACANERIALRGVRGLKARRRLSEINAKEKATVSNLRAQYKRTLNACRKIEEVQRTGYLPGVHDDIAKEMDDIFTS